jgi:biopolymer transport protein ExbB
MHWLLDWYEAIRDFLEMGGPVLLVIGLLTLVMWVMIFERLIYFHSSHRRMVHEVMSAWEARGERSSWRARKIRMALISRVSLAIDEHLPLIKTLVALCPLLGLLGTVTGMIEVFEVMAFSGSGNPRSMAAGVSKATIPTMAGMVAALSGVFAATLLSRFAHREVEHLKAELTTKG